MALPARVRVPGVGRGAVEALGTPTEARSVTAPTVVGRGESSANGLCGGDDRVGDLGPVGRRRQRVRRLGSAGGELGELGEGELVGRLPENRRQRYAEGTADRGEKLARRFLLAALDLGEVAEGDPGRRRDLAQGPL